MKIVVFAANECKKEKESFYFDLAYQTGKLLAEAGFVTVTGGGPGMMDKVSQGAFEAGGKTIGICLDIPGRRQSSYLSEKILYPHLDLRQAKLISLADGFLALPGGVGTLYEVAAVLAKKKKGEIVPDKPFILISSFYFAFEKIIQLFLEEGMIGEEIKSYYRRVNNPFSAVNYLKKFFKSISYHDHKP